MRGENERLCRICIGILCLVLSLVFSEVVSSAETLAVYILGGDLEEKTGAASRDVFELLTATKESSHTVRIRLCGSNTWWFPPLKDHRNYDLELLNGRYRILQEHNFADYTSSEALSDFLNSCPEDTKALILWGHGDSDGLSLDALHHNNSSLTCSEIREGIQCSQVNLDLIGFDACSMASVHCFKKLSPVCEILAASPNEERVTGWQYRDILQIFVMDTEEKIKFLRNMRLRSPDGRASGLTVLSSSAFRNCQEDIALILDSAMHKGSALSEIVGASSNQMVRDKILRMLDGQELLVGQ